MSFYDLSKEDRIKAVDRIHTTIRQEIHNGSSNRITEYFSDSDTYIRKAAYQSMGRIYSSEKSYQKRIIRLLDDLISHPEHNIRQTTINAAGEIGKSDFETVRYFFDQGLFDLHHTIRNAVIGSIKKMGEVNPAPVLLWASKYLHHPDKEIRREICHGIELRGRTYPQDILPLLKELENDKTARVRNTLIHVVGQISYKKGCLKTVLAHLKTWTNKELVADALEEIIDVHDRYKKFSAMSQDEAREYISNNYNDRAYH